MTPPQSRPRPASAPTRRATCIRLWTSSNALTKRQAIIVVLGTVSLQQCKQYFGIIVG